MSESAWMDVTESEALEEGDFPFIVSSGPKLQNDPTVRTLIRQRAMKNAAQKRRERGNYGRVNLGQLPVLNSVDKSQNGPARCSVKTLDPPRQQTTGSEESDSSADISPAEHDQRVSVQVITSKNGHRARTISSIFLPSPATTRPLLDYEAVCSKFQVAMSDLAMLTSFGIGKPTMAALSADPSRLKTLLGHSKWSYMQFVPSHYGISPCLTAATDCILAKVRSLLVPDERNVALELKLYTRALRSLQTALQEPSTCVGADVLCATQLLSLHELLNTTRHEAYSHHIDGFTRLVKHKTPDQFDTEFEKALLIAHIGQAVSGSIADGEHCYLEDPRWLGLYQSLSQNSQELDDRSPLAINIWTQMILLPGLSHDMEKVIIGPWWFEDDLTEPIETRCRKMHQSLSDSLQQYRDHCTRLSLVYPSDKELDTRRGLFGIVLECLAFVKRVLITLCEDERARLEPEAQTLAQMLLEMHKTSCGKHSWIFIGHEVGVASSIISTKTEWEKPLIPGSKYERKVASRERYNAWRALLIPGEEY